MATPPEKRAQSLEILEKLQTSSGAAMATSSGRHVCRLGVNKPIRFGGPERRRLWPQCS